MERSGLVIGIVGAVFLRRMYLHLVHRAAEKFLPKQADSVADSGQSADLRTGKRDIHHDRVAAHCGFQPYSEPDGQKFIRIELHDPDRRSTRKKPDCQRAYALANEILWIPLRNHGFNSRYRHGGTRKNPAGVFTGIPRKIRCELTDPPAKAVLRADPAYRRKYARTVRQ